MSGSLTRLLNILTRRLGAMIEDFDNKLLNY